MPLGLSFVAHTANILGIFSDPFEFAGDYGPEINPVRDKVFELIVAREAICKNLSDPQVRSLLQQENASHEAVRTYRKYIVERAIEQDRNHGPTWSELIPPALIEELKKKQHDLQSDFNQNELGGFLAFLERYGKEKPF